MNKRPFIYIAALPRTGSTLLSELFTDLPYSFIFHEPHLGKNYFAAQKLDKSLLAKYNIDINGFLKLRLPLAFCLRRLRWAGYRQDHMMRTLSISFYLSYRLIFNRLVLKRLSIWAGKIMRNTFLI